MLKYMTLIIQITIKKIKTNNIKTDTAEQHNCIFSVEIFTSLVLRPYRRSVATDYSITFTTRRPSHLYRQLQRREPTDCEISRYENRPADHSMPAKQY